MSEQEFENQRNDEEIIFVKRRHPWVLAKYGVILVITALIVFAAFLIWGVSTVSAMILAAAVIFTLAYSGGRWFVYTNDIFILTNQRIINIDQSSFFGRRVSEAELENIQNVTYEIKGPIKSFLNFGNITVSTAGTSPGLTFKNVENPHFIQEKIITLQNSLKKKKDNKTTMVIR